VGRLSKKTLSIRSAFLLNTDRVEALDKWGTGGASSVPKLKFAVIFSVK
jgi:hypothetical protein